MDSDSGISLIGDLVDFFPDGFAEKGLHIGFGDGNDVDTLRRGLGEQPLLIEKIRSCGVHLNSPPPNNDLFDLKTIMTTPENHHLISTLIHEIPLLPTFKSKWSLINKQLTQLQSHLHDLSDFPAFSSDPLSSHLSSSISLTLNHALSLAHSCKDPSLSAGKLRTQSDVDSIAAKLDQHNKDADLLIGSGVLDQNVTASRSKREAVRVEARSLITRLQIGDFELKNPAMDSLLGLLQVSDKNVVIAVAQGVVPVLVRLLDSSSVEIKEKAVLGIARVSVVDTTNHVLVAEGILLLSHLLRVLESGSGIAKENACVALRALSFSKENARAIGTRGGISSLLEICQAGTHTSQVVAAGVLRNLALIPEIKMNFVEENAIPVLIALVASGSALAQENAIGCLCNLVLKDKKLKILVVKEGGIECLKSFWDSAPTDSSLEVALELLLNLASYRPIAEVIVSNGFIPRLAILLSSVASGVRIAASNVIFELGFCTATRKEMGEVECVPPLVRMLDAKSVKEKETAAKALSSGLQYVENRRIFRKEDRSIAATVQLLAPSLHGFEKRYAVSILLLFAHSKKCRTQMVAAGACAYLHKQADMEIEGAKKLAESLGRGKLWGVFA